MVPAQFESEDRTLVWIGSRDGALARLPARVGASSSTTASRSSTWRTSYPSSLSSPVTGGPYRECRDGAQRGDDRGFFARAVHGGDGGFFSRWNLRRTCRGRYDTVALVISVSVEFGAEDRERWERRGRRTLDQMTLNFEPAVGWHPAAGCLRGRVASRGDDVVEPIDPALATVP